MAQDYPVLHQKTSTGFVHRVYIMYHSTKPDRAESILKSEFKPSGGGNLGMGVYASRSPEKAQHYGSVQFKLLVYVGKTKIRALDSQSDWHDEAVTAFYPGTGKRGHNQESCIKNPKQIRILGVCSGFEYLSEAAQAMTRSVPPKGFDPKDEEDAKTLEDLKKAFKL